MSKVLPPPAGAVVRIVGAKTGAVAWSLVRLPGGACFPRWRAAAVRLARSCRETFRFPNQARGA